MYCIGVEIMEPKNKGRILPLLEHIVRYTRDITNDSSAEISTVEGNPNQLQFNLYTDEQVQHFIEKVYDHKHSPLRGFEKVKSFDIELFIMEDNGYALQIMFEEEKRLSRRLLSLTSNTLSALQEDINETSETVKLINDYLSGSGIIHYKQFMDQFIDMLGQNQLIPNAEYVKERMFNQKTH